MQLAQRTGGKGASYGVVLRRLRMLQYVMRWLPGQKRPGQPYPERYMPLSEEVHT